MFRILQFTILPIAAVFCIGGLAVAEWGKVVRQRKLAETFFADSRVVHFSYAGNREFGGRPFPTYEYMEDGQVREFATHRRLSLPPDGRVRIGTDPSPPPDDPFSKWLPGEIVVPMNGPDSVGTVYHGMMGRQFKADATKASVVSAAALVAGVAGFFLQRKIFGGIKGTLQANTFAHRPPAA